MHYDLIVVGGGLAGSSLAGSSLAAAGLGDAAATGDPAFGLGLGMALYDARILRDLLLADDDWDAMAHAYAAEHDRSIGAVHCIENWLTELVYSLGPEAGARRAYVAPPAQSGARPQARPRRARPRGSEQAVCDLAVVMHEVYGVYGEEARP